jgi:hypothetical protein
VCAKNLERISKAETRDLRHLRVPCRACQKQVLLAEDKASNRMAHRRRDRCFNPRELLAEIDMATELSFLDRLSYHYILIPRARHALLDQNSAIVDSTLRLHRQDAMDRRSPNRRMRSGATAFAIASPVASVAAVRIWQPR